MASAPVLLALILAGMDLGYVINVVFKKLEKIGIAGMCIEDKIFPKTNSLISGARQPLADIDEFCGRIKAAKDAQTDPDFCVIARIEAFIGGWGLKEALKRAQAYYKAGADAILVHSKKPTAEEIISFAREWQNACPIVIVPTTYYTTPIEVFEKYKIKVLKATEILSGSYVPKNMLVLIPTGKVYPDYLSRPSSLFILKKEKIAHHSYYGILGMRLDNGDSTLVNADTVPNTVVAPLILLRLGVPVDEYMDSLDLALKLCNKERDEVKYMNYLSRWKIYKRVVSRVTSRIT